LGFERGYLMKKKVLIKAPMLSRSGYGEHARFVLRALRSKEELFDIYILNIRWGDTGWIWENNEERQYIDEAIKKTVLMLEGAKKAGQHVHFDVSLQVTIPQEWEKLAAVNIGCTAGTETTKMSPQWVEKSNLMDKILVVSEHTKYAFDNTVYKFQHPQTGQEIVFRNETPVEVTHYPVRKATPCPEFLELDFKHDFNFLCNAQWSPRKNLENTVRWWLEEFQDKPYGLILKGNFAKNCVMDREKFEQRINHILKDFEDRECSVYYLHGDMTEEELSALYQHQKVKCFINLAHGEGFGLPVFEAAYYGLPVIAPDWGGVVDFLYAPDDKGKKKAHFLKVDYDLKPVQEEAVWEPVLIRDSLWAFPKRFSYVSRLRDIVKSYGVYHSKAKRLRKWLLKEFEKDVKYKSILDSLDNLATSVPETSEEIMVF
jgi:glycosyltransferase involved in cell wall biosynthesis